MKINDTKPWNEWQESIHYLQLDQMHWIGTVRISYINQNYVSSRSYLCYYIWNREKEKSDGGVTITSLEGEASIC